MNKDTKTHKHTHIHHSYKILIVIATHVSLIYYINKKNKKQFRMYRDSCLILNSIGYQGGGKVCLLAK